MASTRKQRGSLILPLMQTPQTDQTPQSAGVIPQWARPDDAQREARLKAMKRRATGLLAGALVGFVAARGVEPAYPWLGYVPATPRAPLGGGPAGRVPVPA